MEYPFQISIKVEEDELELDSNDNIKQLLFDVDVKVENEFQTHVERDWCISNFENPGDLLEPLFFKQTVEPLASKCDLCRKYFSNEYAILKHNLAHIRVLIKNPEVYQCDSCAAFFTTMQTLNHHISTNKCTPNSTSLVCTNTIRTNLQNKLKAYVPHNRPGTDLVTKKYGVTYQRMQNKCILDSDTRKLKDGMTNMLSYKPKECKKVKLKHGKKLRQCNICSKTYTYTNWHAHMNEVHGEGGFICGICNIEFKCERYFSRHMQKVHIEKRVCKGAEKKDIPCDECDTVLHSMNALTTHKRNVHSQGDYMCSICKSILKCKAYLLTHMRRVHYNDGKMHVCECGKKFRSPRYLTVHKKNAHMKK